MYSDRRVSLDIAPLASWDSCSDDEKTVVVLVGLPARGKSYISTKLSRYLNWVGINTRVFNVGAYRRLQMKDYNDHSYFSDENNEGVALRQKIASEALDDLISWLTSDVGRIAVFDATNTTRERRLWIMERCKTHNFQVIFVESICKDKNLIQENVLEVKVNSPDYKSIDKEEALKDFLKRIEHYEKRYESIDDDLDKDWSYIKIFDQGKRYLANRIEGNINSRIVYYLMNIRVNKRTIYLTRHGETDLNIHGRIGGDGKLSERGELYAKKLAAFMEQEKLENLKVWTSHFKRTIQTAEHIQCSQICYWKALDELDAGVCDGMTYEEIHKKYPDDFARRDNNKYYYRYPMGESYQDLVTRLEPVIMELERQTSVLVICHQAVARCLLAYFEDKNKDELPYIHVPLHTVFKLTPTAYRCIVERVKLNVPAVETHRMKPENTKTPHSSFEAMKTVPAEY
ncbi:unnamed protein product [Schistosoma intercalatum]|nr:unnamed protein product [Schistosoma intercalatum]